MIDGNTGRTDHGVLKRFVAQPTQGWEVNDILEAAEAANADVWQVGHSHVDIFSHNDFQSPLNDAKLLLQSQSQIPNTHASQPPVRLSPGSWDLSSLANTTYHSSYHPLYEIEEFMQEMAEQYPGFVQLVNLGHSAEGREMFAMRLSKTRSYPTEKAQLQEAPRNWASLLRVPTCTRVDCHFYSFIFGTRSCRKCI
ncbi:hypothetical protein A0H81_01861 [Grifola frondosa]|uniref:Peptidase M14 domain-containing protein n=1 Tax=Grifola frondosa TaxID=5627 RepID=A0A1C7MMU9_GRIFR|nr:hypothetical protein A0H81_01861 [Grifola frondosa]